MRVTLMAPNMHTITLTDAELLYLFARAQIAMETIERAMLSGTKIDEQIYDTACACVRKLTPPQNAVVLESGAAQNAPNAAADLEQPAAASGAAQSVPNGAAEPEQPAAVSEAPQPSGRRFCFLPPATPPPPLVVDLRTFTPRQCANACGFMSAAVRGHRRLWQCAHCGLEVEE